MNTMEQISIENVLQKNALLHSNEKLVDVFENNDKKDKKALVITNLRVLLFDVHGKEHEIILNENIKFFSLNQNFFVSTSTHFLTTDLILSDTKSEVTMRKIDKEDAIKIKEIIKTLKFSRYTQKNTDDKNNEPMRSHDQINYKHTKSHERSFIKNKSHSKRHHRLPIRNEMETFQKSHKYCTHCGTAYNPQESSCKTCGEILTLKRDLEKTIDQETYKFCPYCNTKLYESDLFCSECGLKVL